MTIHTLIPVIMGEVGSISKARKSPQGYLFRGIDDLYLALQGVLSKHGVYFVPEVLEQTREEKQTKSGGHLTYTMLKIAYTFYAADGSCVRSVTVGEGMDSSDKSSNKAMSAALKYALLQIFCIPTEEPKDSENEDYEVKPRQAGPAVRTPNPSNGARSADDAPEAATSSKAGHDSDHITEKQQKRLFAISKECNWSKDNVRDYLGKLGIEHTDQLNWFQYETMIKNMQTFHKN